MEIKRSIRCSKCGETFYLNVETNLQSHEFVITGRCKACGTTIQVNFEIIEGNYTSVTEEASSETGATNDGNTNEEDGLVDIEQEFPTDALDSISDIMSGE